MTKDDLNQDNSSVADVGVSQLIHQLVGKWRPLLLGACAAAVMGYGVSFLVQPTYTAVTTFIPPSQGQNQNAMLQSLGSFGGMMAGTAFKNPTEQYVSFLKSRAVRQVVIDELELKSYFGKTVGSDVIRQLSASTRIYAGKDGIVTIEADDAKPEMSAKIANAHTTALSNLLSRLALSEAQQRRKFYSEQLASTKDKLAAAESALKSSGLDLGALRVSPDTAFSDLASLRAQISATEVKLFALRRSHTDASPEVKTILAQMASLQSQVRKYETSTAAAPDSQDYFKLYRDVKYQESMFEVYARQLEMARLDEAREGGDIQILDVANTPDRKSRPRGLLYALAGALLMTMALLIFYVLRFDRERNLGKSEAWRI